MATKITVDDFKQAYEEVRRDEEMHKFVKHVVAYAAINVLLAVMNFIYSPGVLWFFYPLLGWGIVIAVHYLEAVMWVDTHTQETLAHTENRAIAFKKRVEASMKK
ncbi:MAG: 2TM domain-containing protein [Candidatus Altiarchaeota archaeon]|nr:2TM domain-containing protein [Candidatus Altiarchaeota archaeon]